MIKDRKFLCYNPNSRRQYWVFTWTYYTYYIYSLALVSEKIRTKNRRCISKEPVWEPFGDKSWQVRIRMRYNQDTITGDEGSVHCYGLRQRLWRIVSLRLSVWCKSNVTWPYVELVFYNYFPSKRWTLNAYERRDGPFPSVEMVEVIVRHAGTRCRGTRLGSPMQTSVFFFFFTGGQTPSKSAWQTNEYVV